MASGLEGPHSSKGGRPAGAPRPRSGGLGTAPGAAKSQSPAAPLSIHDPLQVGCHTTESRISEPRRTRGRGHTGDTSTKLSWMLSGLFSDSVKACGPGELSDRAW